MAYAESNTNNSNNKRARYDEQLQTLQLQQRSAASRALDRLKKTEKLTPIEHLVLMFNMHFQRRDAPSYRVVSESALRVLHPTYFDFVPLSEWITERVPEEDLPELLIAIDEIVESHRAVLGSDWDLVANTNADAADSQQHQQRKEAPPRRKLPAPTADGMVGWGDEEENEDDGEEATDMTFSKLLGEEEENVVGANTDEERTDIALEAFWGLVAECVEATIRYREVRDALGGGGSNGASAAVSAGHQPIRSNPLLEIFSSMGAPAGADRDGKSGPTTAPTIDLGALGPLASSAVPTNASTASVATTITGAKKQKVEDGSTAHATANFYGYHRFLTEAAALVANVPISDLSQAQRYLASLAAVPASDPSSFAAAGAGRGMFGPQAHFIYRIALGDCTQRLAKFHLDCFVRLYRKGRVGGDPIDPIAEASAEAESFFQHALAEAREKGAPPPSAEAMQKMQLQWQHRQYQAQYYPNAASTVGTDGILPAPTPANLAPRSYELPPIPAFAVSEAETIRENRIRLLNQRGGSSTDNMADFIRNGFGVDYIPTEEDFAKAMANDGVGANEAYEGIGGAAKTGGQQQPQQPQQGAAQEGESVFKEEIHDYYVSHLARQKQGADLNNKAQQIGNAAAAAAASGSPSLLVAPDGKPRIIKPVRYCRVKTGYVWNAYNRAKYSLKTNEKPPQVVQWYEFTLHYNLIASTIRSAKDLFRVELTEKGEEDDHRIIVFSAGPPYADVAYKIVNEPWDRRPGGVRCSIDDKGRFRLFFRLASTNYRR